jgi:glycosyltransferase involved in cell wall biosynthesis
MTPRVSILVPAYNAADWIEQTLASAVGQDYARKEVIVVNDGSRDDTLRRAKGFESRGVKVIDQPNAGGPAARNRALAEAQGDYLQWLDHDDLLAPNKLSGQVRAAQAAADDRRLFSAPFGRFFWRPERARFVPTALWRDLTPAEYFYEKFRGNIYFQSSAWLVSRKLSDLAGPWWDLRSPDDDGEYFCRVVAASTGIRFVPEARSYWRIGNSGSFSEARTPAAMEAIFQSTNRCIDHFLRLEDSAGSRAACVQFLQDRLGFVFPEDMGIVARMEARAQALGGRLQPPVLKPKYRLLAALVGEGRARRAAKSIRKAKATVTRQWDYLMYKLTARAGAGSAGGPGEGGDPR